MSVDDLTVPLQSHGLAQRRLLVTEQDSEHFYRPVGFLSVTPGAETDRYTFEYLRSAVRREGFRPFLGFADVGRVYRSDGLFPLFAERIMDPRRPEHPVFLAALDLSGEVTPLEVLARSGGQRTGDGIMLLPVPEVQPDGATHCFFLVHGVRHVEGADERVGRLSAGTALALQPQPDNRWNPHAQLVVEGEGQPLGYVPDALLEYVTSVDGARLTVARVNGPEVGSRLRLLVRLDGSVDPQRPPFSGPLWDTVTEFA